MSGFVLAIMSLVCGALVAIAFGYWFKGGYVNAKIGFYWLSAACVVFGIVVLSAYWYYVVKPAQSDTAADVARRPTLMFLDPSLDQLTEGKPLVSSVLLRNTSEATAYHLRVCGQMTLMDSTFKGSLKPVPGPNRTGFEADAIPTGRGAKIFFVPPKEIEFLQITKELIEAINNGSKQIVIFGTGEYQDSVGNKYPLDFCFLYSPEARHLVNCPARYRPAKDPNTNCD